jgi:hypothetical protein
MAQRRVGPEPAVMRRPVMTSVEMARIRRQRRIPRHLRSCGAVTATTSMVSSNDAGTDSAT